MPAKEDKVQQVEKLAEGLKESSAVVFTDYSGLSMPEMTDLRGRLSQLGAELKVVKNTLIKLAAEKARLPLEEELVGPTAILFSQKADPIKSIKTIVSFLKEKRAVKFGVFERNLLDASEVLELARLPTKTVLEGRLIEALNMSIAKFVLTLKESQRGLVAVLSKVSEAGGGGQ